MKELGIFVTIKVSLLTIQTAFVMQAYRTHAKVEEGQVIVQLPDTFTGTEVEVIVLPSESAPVTPKSKKNMSKYRGVLKSGLSRETIDQQLQTLRNEWERPV